MVHIQFLTAENRRGKKKEEDSNHAQLKKYNGLSLLWAAIIISMSYSLCQAQHAPRRIVSLS